MEKEPRTMRHLFRKLQDVLWHKNVHATRDIFPYTKIIGEGGVAAFYLSRSPKGNKFIQRHFRRPDRCAVRIAGKNDGGRHARALIVGAQRANWHWSETKIIGMGGFNASRSDQGAGS